MHSLPANHRLSRTTYSFVVVLLLALAASSRAASVEPSVVIRTFTAGGKEQQLQLQPPTPTDRRTTDRIENRVYAPVRLPVTAQALDFRIAPNPDSTHEPIRTQYKLYDWDEDWREAEGLMWLSTRYLDDRERRVGGESFPRSGRSSGWTGDPNNSPLRVSSEYTVPPADARKLQLFLAAGGPRTTGTWLVKSIRVIATPGGGEPEKVLKTIRIEGGDELDQPLGLPADWRREGSTLSIAQLITFPEATTSSAERAFALIDHDSRSTGRWVSFGENLIDVRAGVPLRIEIEEAFSIGAGGDYSCTYQKLPTGRYRLQVIPVDEFGMQSGVGVELPFVLLPPFHATWWFWAIVGLGVVGGVAGSVRYTTYKRMHRRLEELERRRAVEAERMRIAQDIHDDMGARLTQISLASGLALRKSPPDSPVIGELKKLDRAARDVALALDEIVWAVNPEHDTLEGLANYVSQYVTEATAEGDVLCRLQIPAILPAQFISSGVRHHLLMALKEAINNALKHSGASEVRVQLTFEERSLTLTVADNGCGFDLALASRRNGIANMQRRLATLGGRCEIESGEDKGTRVTFSLRLTATPREDPRQPPLTR